MPKPCFIVGHEDTPEAYWRVLLPARSLRAPALFLEDPRAEEQALAADVIWLYQPTGYAAAELAEKAKARGKRVICDLAEDPWQRADYNTHRLEACRRALEAAQDLVVASEALAAAFPGAISLPTRISLSGWEPVELLDPPTLVWWTDGRQKEGWELVAGQVGALLEDRGLRLHQVQFPHSRPLHEGASEERSRARARHCHTFLAGEGSPDQQLVELRRGAEGCFLHLETYMGAYGETVSDLALLRAAALGIPSLTLRSTAPQGAQHAPLARFGDEITRLLDEPARWRILAEQALAWARSRASFDIYQAILGGD